MNIEDIDRKIGMPDVDREWEKFRREVIGHTPSRSREIWKKASAVVGIVFGVALAVMASVATIRHTQTKQVSIDTSVEDKPLVEYFPKKKSRWGDGFIVNLCPGVYVNHVKGRNHLGEFIMIEGETFATGSSTLDSYIEDTHLRYIFLNGRQRVTMKIDGKAFDKDHMPMLTNKTLKKMEITPDGHWAVTVNLVTKDDMIPSPARSNAIREHTIFLHADGRLGICEGQGTRGNWIHHSLTSWEQDPFNWSVREEIKPSLKYADYKLYVYASRETPQTSLERAESLIQEMNIPHYEFCRNLPAVHWTDGQYRAWAQKMQREHPQYDWKFLFEELAKENIDDDLRERWHIVKQVYGVE